MDVKKFTANFCKSSSSVKHSTKKLLYKQKTKMLVVSEIKLINITTSVAKNTQ